MPGIVRTRCGYSGGTKKNPTYNAIGDHTETMQFDYDPTKITYKQLLEVFWTIHNPCATPYSRQYMSAIFYANDEQKKIAEETRDAAAAKQKGKLTTQLLPLGEFTIAEDYHQKYYLRQDAELMAEFKTLCPTDKDLLNSTVAARVNSFISGYGTSAQLEKEIGDYGLSEKAKQRLRTMVRLNEKLSTRK